jgi:3-hydroxybutyryl-CoA dehydrogenase
VPQINEAVELLENKVATKEDIDVAVKMALNHSREPLTLADLITIGTSLVILETLYRALGSDCYKPRKLVYDMVLEYTRGQKTGQGF